MLDLFIDYLYVLKFISLFLLVVLFVFGLDDLFIDVYYWLRKLRRKRTIYTQFKHADPRDLFVPKQKPIAILIPAWQEVGVVGPMADAAVKALDYENYQIFVGTYPNDPATQADIDEVCRNYDNVHKVVCALPGPTSKADCLNNIIAAITEFERTNRFEFQGFVLHDAEDMISPLELRLFNYLLNKNKDLIQIPVYPYTKHWYQFTAAHYIDEFAELHGKDVVVRESIAGQVPSAGVGTCFSRQAILKLLLEGDGVAFDTRSLTEDYDIGFRLKKWGMKEIFVRFAAEAEDAVLREKNHFVHDREHRVICVREYFPSRFSQAVRQKSRWIVGIVFQGFRTHRWTKDFHINYFLWRDRRGVIANIVSFLAMLVFFQLVVIYAYQSWVPNAYHFLSIFSDDNVVMLLLSANLLLFFNRLLQRFIFTSQFYGVTQGLLSVPRMVWANIINFVAVLRAIKLVIIAQGSAVAWDKTQHDFPHVLDAKKRLIGELLLEHKLLTEQQLSDALINKPLGMRLGAYLIQERILSPQQLGELIAKTNGLDFQRIEPFQLSTDLVQKVPGRKALMYRVLPVHYDESANRLTLASESVPSKVALASLRRATGAAVKVVISQPGAVSVGLRYWYLNDESVKQRAQQQPDLDAYFAVNESLGQILVNMNLIAPATLRQAELDYYDSEPTTRFGELLIAHGWLKQDQLDLALNEQARRLNLLAGV